MAIIGANAGMACLGFIFSNILQRHVTKKEAKKQKKTQEEIQSILQSINSIISPDPTNATLYTPSEKESGEPYGNDGNDGSEGEYELKPYYDTKTKQTIFKYVHTPRPYQKAEERKVHKK